MFVKKPCINEYKVFLLSFITYRVLNISISYKNIIKSEHL